MSASQSPELSDIHHHTAAGTAAGGGGGVAAGGPTSVAETLQVTTEQPASTISIGTTPLSAAAGDPPHAVGASISVGGGTFCVCFVHFVIEKRERFC